MPNLPNRIREAHLKNKGALWIVTRQIQIAFQVFTPVLSFGLVLHALFGLAFILAAIQREVDVSPYRTLTGGHTWALGALYVFVFVCAVCYPIRGGLVAIVIFSLIGTSSYAIRHDILTLVFYVGLPYFSFRTMRRKQQLLEWILWRRRLYDEERDAALRANG